MSEQVSARTDDPTVPDVPAVPGTLWCWPGPRAKATFINADPNDRMLVIFCDPVSLILTVPPGPAGQGTMAGLLRQLAGAATRMATVLDSEHEPRSTAERGRR